MKIMNTILRVIFCQFLLCIIVFSGAGQPTASSPRAVEFDKIISEQFKPNESGCVALVAENGKIIYEKAFGLADIQLNVPMRTEMVFRLGSISKQFTAISILQLMEKGKLALQDRVITHIPDYPAIGEKITIEHLLTHTSGITNITGMKNFGDIKRNDLSTAEVVNFFKNEPLEFEPGTKWSYSNSGYILLGYIVEKVSGLPFAQYLEEQIFKPCQMTSSFLDDDGRIIKNRASGYAKKGDQTINAQFISMTIPHGAGGIVSTVGDLYRWNRALLSHKMVTKSTLEKAFMRYKLSDGKETDYGYGWFFSNIQGIPTVEHGGGIEGFLTSSIYLPSKDLFVTVFSNSTGQSPEFIAAKLAAVTIGKPYNYKELVLDKSSAEAYVGVYENEEPTLMNIKIEDDKMFAEFPDGNRIQMKPYDKGKYFYHDFFSTMEFSQSPDKKSYSANVISRFEKTRTWKRTDKPFTAKAEVEVSEAILEQYVGEYQVGPSFILTVVKEGKKIFARGPDQPNQELFGESETKFYLKSMPIAVEFHRDSSGKVEKLAIHQGEKVTEAKKIK
jgi:CubicO group peptidase (beta-lactamase class C family)